LVFGLILYKGYFGNNLYFGLIEDFLDINFEVMWMNK